MDKSLKEMLKDTSRHCWIATYPTKDTTRPFGMEELYYVGDTMNHPLERYRYVLGWDGNKFIAPKWLRHLFDHESRAEFDYWVKHDLVLKGGEHVVFYPEREKTCYSAPHTEEPDYIRMPYLYAASTDNRKFAFHTTRDLEPHISPIARAAGIKYLDWTYVHQDGFDYDDGEQYIAASAPSTDVWDALGNEALGYDIIVGGMEMVSITKSDVHVVYITSERRWIVNKDRR